MSKVHVKVGNTVILRVGDYNDKFERKASVGPPVKFWLLAPKKEKSLSKASTR